MLAASIQLSNALEKDELYQQIVEYFDEKTVFHSNQKVLLRKLTKCRFFYISKSALIGVNVVDVFPED